MPTVARNIQPLIGLTRQGVKAVGSYKEFLEKKIPPLKASQIEKKVNFYRKKLIEKRAELIARTETARAINEGTIEGYRQGGIKRVEWVTAAGCCPECDALNGHKFTLEEASGMMPLHPACLIDAKSPVFTSKGWRRIVDISVGELVLTHKGRFKKVIEIHRSKRKSPDVVKLFLGKKHDLERILTVTDYHPILIDGEWKPAEDVRIGDVVSYLANKRVISNHEDNYEFVSLEVTNIKKWRIRKPRTLYNLSVEEDESYVVKGFVVHNCRCTWISVEEPRRIPEAPKWKPMETMEEAKSWARNQGLILDSPFPKEAALEGIKSRKMDLITLNRINEQFFQIQQRIKPELVKYYKKEGIRVFSVNTGKYGPPGVSMPLKKGAMVGIDPSKSISVSNAKNFVDASNDGIVRHELAHALEHVLPHEKAVMSGLFSMDYFASEYSKINFREKWAEFVTKITKPGFKISSLPKNARKVARYFLK